MLLCRLCHEHSAVDANDIHEEKDASEVGEECEKPCLENVEEACSSLKECYAGVLGPVSGSVEHRGLIRLTKTVLVHSSAPVNAIRIKPIGNTAPASV